MKPEIRKNLYRYVAAFLTFAAIVAFALLLVNGKNVLAFIKSIFHSLIPVWIGMILAYLLNPVIRSGERLLTRRKLNQKIARAIMVALVLLVIIFLFFVAFTSIAPQLIRTINNLISELPSLEDTFDSYLESLGNWNRDVYDSVMDMLDSIVQWARTNIFSGINTFTQRMIGLISSVIDIFVGLIVFVYVQLRKERFIGEGKKLLYALPFSQKTNDWILDVMRQTNRIFSGFISGKILDSLIVGVICFLCMNIFRMPYALLISVVIGLTNIIPMFGPLIGAIPCAILLLFISPLNCLIFVILIIVLQQVDGNIIAPRILGNYTGLSAFWVIVAILLFGSLWGFIGMIVGVPIFATLYYIAKKAAEESLRKKRLPVDSMDYVKIDRIEDGPVIHYQPDKKTKTKRQKKEKEEENEDKKEKKEDRKERKKESEEKEGKIHGKDC